MVDRERLDGKRTAAEHSTPENFCPLGGVLGSKSSIFSNNVRCLLRTRLRYAAYIITGGAAAFLVRNLVIPPETVRLPAGGLEIHVAVLAISAVLALLLSTRWQPSQRTLRLTEAVLFGVPAGFFVWMQHGELCYCSVSDGAEAFLAASVIPWVILLHIYGLFIPNTWLRATGVIALMAAAPVLGALAAAGRNPEIATVLYDDWLSSMLLWLSIAGVTAVYGSYRFRALTRQAFDAKSVGVYSLRRKLGAGGMGEVYLAEHRLLKRPCAIKLIRSEKAENEAAIARFESEVQSTARLTHPNTIEIYDYGHTQDGTFYYAMEYLPGLSLQDIVDRYGPLPPERVAYLLRQVCSALREAHAAGLIHRDLKPGNIFAAERGGLYDVAKLLDFGLVKSIAQTPDTMKLTLDGTVIGSPLYAAPETMQGMHPDPRTDIYSLGATAYFLLTGKPVFDGDNPLKVLFAHSTETPEPPSTHRPGLPEDLEAIVLRCLAKDPDDRYGDVTALGADLSHVACAEEWSSERAAEWWHSREAAESSQTDAADTAVTATITVGV